MDSDNEFDKLRALFSDEKTELPDDLKWEFLEDEIMDKIKKDKTSRRPIFIIVFLLGTISLGLFVIRWLHTWQNNDAQESSKSIELKNESSEKHSVNLSDKLFTTLSKEQPELKTPDPKDQSRQNQEGKSLKTGNQQTLAKAKVPMTTLREEIFNLKPASNGTNFQLMNGKTTKAVDDNIIANNVVLINEAATFSSSDITIQNLEKTTYTTDGPSVYSLNIRETALAFLPIIRMEEVKSIKNDSDLILTEPIFIKQQTLSLPINYITLSGGLTFWDFQYSSLLPERNPYEKTILSYHSQLSYTHRFSNNFTFMAGIRHQKMETRLEWDAYLENYATVTLRDTIIAINTNSITGQKSNIRGDVDVNLNATRQVRHFNQYQLYQIPFAIGKVWPITQKWFAELSLGGVVNILGKNIGRNLYQGKIIDFNDSVTPFMDNRWGFQVMGNVKFHYRINKHYGLLIDAGLQKSLKNWSTEANVKMKPLSKNLGIGILYSL